MKSSRLAAVALGLVALVATAVPAQCSFYFTAGDLESDASLWDLYGRWAAHHQVVREPARFATFKANARKLHSKQLHAGELMALNVFGDQSYDELAAKSCLREPEEEEEELPVVDLEALVAGDATALPSRVDWRDANAVTEVKRQASCGCCWAFATAAAVEGRQALLTNKPAVSLSAQFLLDCTHTYIDQFSGCDGGSRWNALKLIKTLGGIPAQSVYPYRGARSNCDLLKLQWSAGVVGWVALQKNNVSMMKLAVSLQPILVSIGVDEDFYNWDPKVRGSVYYGPGETEKITHAVVIVGYDVDDLGGLYWIVKNSWGTDWGDKGYIYISGAADDGFVPKSGVAGILNSGIYLRFSS